MTLSALLGVDEYENAVCAGTLSMRTSGGVSWKYTMVAGAAITSHNGAELLGIVMSA